MFEVRGPGCREGVEASGGAKGDLWGGSVKFGEHYYFFDCWDFCNKIALVIMDSVLTQF